MSACDSKYLLYNVCEQARTRQTNSRKLPSSVTRPSMISDPKDIVKMDEQTDPVQNSQDAEADSEEEHAADEPGAEGEHADTNTVPIYSTAPRPETKEEKEEA